MFCAGNMNGGVDSCQVCGIFFLSFDDKKSLRSLMKTSSLSRIRGTLAALWRVSVMGPTMLLLCGQLGRRLWQKVQAKYKRMYCMWLKSYCIYCWSLYTVGPIVSMLATTVNKDHYKDLLRESLL